MIVGAGPAGATTARYTAMRGLSVLVLERRKKVGVPVQCGEYVAHNVEVRAIFPKVRGLEDLMGAPYSVKQIDTSVTRIVSPKGRTYDLAFKGFTVDRTAMDQAIVAQAIEEGATIKTDVTVNGVRGAKVETTKGVFEAKLIVGADGPMSVVAKAAGLERPVAAPAMSASIAGDFSDITEMHFGNVAPGGYAWIIPKGKSANVGVGVWPRYKGNLKILYDTFLRKLGLTQTRATGGYVPLEGPLHRTVKSNVILVGDAAGHVMPPNGGGINVAMICGRIAGETIADHLGGNVPLEEYERRWREVVGGPLIQGLKTRRLADHFFGRERLLEAAMIFLGKKRMGRAIRCKRLFFDM